MTAVGLAARLSVASVDGMLYLDADELLHRVQRVTEDLALGVAG